jgi:colanic acid biosynthesis glycosyl transferase WcaI
VLAAAGLLRENPHFVFLIIGGGKRYDELASTVEAHGLARSFRFMPYQEHKLLSSSLAVSDVHWLSLNPKLEGMVVPSKFYGIAAAGKPIIAIGGKNGEFARLIREHECGFSIESGDAAGLVGVLLRLAREPETIANMGRRARQMLDAHFTRQQAFTRWCGLLDQLEQRTAQP